MFSCTLSIFLILLLFCNFSSNFNLFDKILGFNGTASLDIFILLIVLDDKLFLFNCNGVFDKSLLF
jgi:hypothetical protein